MNIENLPEIVNNKDLTQHFFYSYAHQKKIGPTDQLKRIFADNLIFDRSRKSIFAQYQEFGYICDKYVSIDMGSYGGSKSSYIDLFAYEGELNAYHFVPFYITNFNVNFTSNKTLTNNLIPLGSTLTINNVSWWNNGSEQRYHFYENDPNEPIKVSDVYVSHHRFSYITNIDDVKTLDERWGETTYTGNKTCTITPSTSVIKASEIGNLTFRLEVSCNECYDIVSTETIEYEVANFFKIFKTTYNNDWYATKEYMEADHTGAWISHWNSVLNVLTNDPSKETLLCDNGYNEFYCVAIPSRIYDRDILYGNLNNGSAQEFIKISPSDSVMETFFIGNDPTEDYSIYLTTGHSWNGSTLTFKNL